MKTTQKVSNKGFIENRFEMSNHQPMIPISQLSAGSVIDKYPVSFDYGKTIIFISDKSKEAETRRRYEQLAANRIVKFVKKAKDQMQSNSVILKIHHD
jgi:hypothetical protein